MHFAFLIPGLLLCSSLSLLAEAPAWRIVTPEAGKLTPRHEAAFVALEGRLHLLGGRRLQPVDSFDPMNREWVQRATPPVEVHHFQPVVWKSRIWLVGAMTGRYPLEKALDHIPIYDPAEDSWSRGPALPVDRRRGGAGAVIYQDSLYVVCGIIQGHWEGHVSWLDRLDLKTGEWTRLPDAPRARDHFQVAVIDGTLYAAGGRRSSGATKQVFALVEPAIDVFDLATEQWSTLPSPAGDLPTPRAGSMTHAYGRWLVVAGGESMAQSTAHAEVEALDTTTGQWHRWPSFSRGRHGSGLALIGNLLYVASGSGNRGGQPELDTLEALDLEPFSR